MIHYCFLTGLYSRRDPLMVDRQGASLVKAGFTVSYIVCDHLPNECVEGINIISTGFVPKNRIMRFILTKKKVLTLALDVDADIYQISDPELISLVIPLKRKGKKVVFNLREYYPDMILHKKYIPTYLRSIIARYSSYIMSRYLPEYDAVFTVTPQFVDFLKEKHNVKKSYLLTNYPIPDLMYHLKKEEYLNKPNVLLYEGSIYASSRQEAVFDALSQVKDIKYKLAGKIEERCEYIKQHPYWGEVEFIDGFDKIQLKQFFGEATISNVLRDFGTHDGSLGVIKLFESMEAGLPVLLPDVPLYRDLVKRYYCGICVDPNDPLAIRNAINYLIDNKEVAYEMGQNGRRAVLEEYNWEKQAENYIRIINNIYTL